MRLSATDSSCRLPLFLAGITCALAAAAVVCASGCMTDASRTALQGAMTDVNAVKATAASTPPIGGTGDHDPSTWGR
jgi:hypothetical protein